MKDFREMVQTLLELSDNQWGIYAFDRDPLEGKFSPEEKRVYIDKANEYGRKTARAKSEKYREIHKLASGLGVKIEYSDATIGGGHIVFAQFIEPNHITIFKKAVGAIQPFFEEIHTLTGDVDIVEVLLAHEIFHYIEHIEEQTIYTRIEKVELWRWPFSNKSRIRALSEIAGMAFAKEFLKLSYSPFIFDFIFMYGYDQEAAIEMYEDIVKSNRL